MTREKVLSLLKGKTIKDILETNVLRESEPLLITGFTLDDGYVVYLKPVGGTDS